MHGFECAESGCRRLGIRHDGIEKNVSSLSQVSAEILRRVQCFDAAFVDDDDARAEHLHLGKNVGRKKDGMVAAQIANQVANKAYLIRVQSDGWLVENQELWFVAHRIRQPHALPVAFGQVADDLFFHILQPAKLQHIADALLEAAAWNTLEGRTVTKELMNPHVGVKRDIFRHVANVLPGAKRVGKHIESSDLCFSRGGGKEA